MLPWPIDELRAKRLEVIDIADLDRAHSICLKKDRRPDTRVLPRGAHVGRAALELWRQWRTRSGNNRFTDFRAYKPELPDPNPSIAARSVAVGGSVYGQVAPPGSVIARKITTEDTTKPNPAISKFAPAKVSTVKTAAPKTAAVGLRDANPGHWDEGECNGGGRYQ
jgi:hypothetical protein